MVGNRMIYLQSTTFNTYLPLSIIYRRNFLKKLWLNKQLSQKIVTYHSIKFAMSESSPISIQVKLQQPKDFFFIPEKAIKLVTLMTVTPRWTGCLRSASEELQLSLLQLLLFGME